MNIISNNCIGGFIYKELLKTQYRNPFIWTALSTLDFLYLCDNFNKINFENISISKTDGKMKNNFILTIDDTIKLANHHIWFDVTCNEPTIKQSMFGIDVHYIKPWEYIVEKYEKRLARMDKDEQRCYVYYDDYYDDRDERGSNVANLERLIEICDEQNQLGIIITHKNIERESKNVLVLKSSPKWWTEPGGWHDSVLGKLGGQILEFLTLNSK